MLINEWFDIGSAICLRACVNDNSRIKNQSEYECNFEAWIRF